MGSLIFSTTVQPIRAEVPEEWRYDEDNWEKYWEELEAEKSKKYQEEISESVRKTLEQDQIKRMEEEGEQAKSRQRMMGLMWTLMMSQDICPIWRKRIMKIFLPRRMWK